MDGVLDSMGWVGGWVGGLPVVCSHKASVGCCVEGESSCSFCFFQEGFCLRERWVGG